MKNFSLLVILTSVLIGMTSCGNKENEKDSNIITEKIEYPVFIKSPYGDDQADWWKENIETSKRHDFVQTLLDWAYSGKVKAYDYLTNKLLTTDQVKAIGNEIDTITLTSPNPPYEERDTVIQQKLDIHQIQKLKFLEEWRFDTKNHTLQKEVIGIAPTLTIYTDSSEIKGYKPLFWIYFDDRFAKTEEKK